MAGATVTPRAVTSHEQSQHKDRGPDTRTGLFNAYSNGGYHTALDALGKSNFICRCHLWTTVQRACKMQIGHV